MRLTLIAFLSLSTAQFAWSEESARIYVYALRETPARSWRPICCDGAMVAKIRRGTFFAISVTPGRHVLSDQKGVPTFVDVKAGGESFVRRDWNVEIGQPSILVLSNVRADLARKEMRFALYIDKKQVLSGSVPKTDPSPPAELRLKTRGGRSNC